MKQTMQIRSRWCQCVLGLIALILGLAGLYFLYGGLQLAWLGGSYYYMVMGALLVASGYGIWRGQLWGAYLYGIGLLGTIIWSLAEVGFEFWPLTARIATFALIGVFIALITPRLQGHQHPDIVRRVALCAAGGLTAGLVATVAAAFQPVWIVKATVTTTAARISGEDISGSDWVNYGRTPDGTQYAPFTQITPENVANLQVAWTFRTGDIAYAHAENQNTPLQIGDVLYACTPSHKVFAIHAGTGEQIWTFDPQYNAAAYNPLWRRCRSLAYHENQTLQQSHGQLDEDAATTCSRRIYVATGDVKIHAINADSGLPCESFADHGVLSLLPGMGAVFPGAYYSTSGPLIAGDLLVVGGYVMDNQSLDAPPGVIRAFDAVSGQLVWAWDAGRPDRTAMPDGEDGYTRGTPNMWSFPSFDAELGLLYLPMGGDGVDMFSGTRSPESERVSSAIVALDAKTGRERWVFKTVYRDVWDFDLPSKPILHDVTDSSGQRVPALIQTTKRGEIFVLDRRTGTPITEVEERQVPRGGVPGETLSPVQPYSVGMPTIKQPQSTEARMWGITPFDQLACRIAFKKVRYEGDFTPPGTDWYIPEPSPLGGMNWGGGSLDKTRNYLIVNDIRLMLRARLLPRQEVQEAMVKTGKAMPGMAGIIPMENTPYGADRAYMNSSLGIPCGAPPFGTLTAIDLDTRQIVWQRSLGTAQEFGPWGTKLHLPVEIGMPTLGGPVSTASGLVFFAGTADYYLRAMDVTTGEEIWKSPLPVGSQGTPLIYVSPSNGKQYVVVTAGGSRRAPDKGDYIIAYALPD